MDTEKTLVAPDSNVTQEGSPSPPPSVVTQTENRFIKGSKTDWMDLIDHKTVMPADMPLEQVQDFFRAQPEARFAVVLDDANAVLGICSEQKINNTLSQWGLGYAVFARKPVRNHILEVDFRIIHGTPVYKVLNAIMKREDDFFDDVILVDQEHRFLGMIRVATLVHLQHEINRQQYTEIKGISEQLNQNNEELQAARDSAEQAARMKSTFLANMSHEIRTPMNGILGMIKILLRTPLSDQQKRYAQTVQHSGNALLTILNDILDFSKIEAGKLEIEEIDFDLTDIIEETVQLMAEKAQEKSIELFSWINGDINTQLISDPNRLRQVLLNLTSNAIKFTEKGEVMVRVSRVDESKDTLTLKISVIDTGIGINKENQEKLFQAFQQADSSTSRKFGGTGLGLAISKRIIELLQGTIRVESEAGKGSNFSMTIPFKKQRNSSNGKDTQTVRADFWGLRALVISDSEGFGRYMQQLVEPWSVNCRHTESFQDAFDMVLQQAERGSPLDLILLDSKIGTQSGLDLAKQLRSHRLTKQSKIIMMMSQAGELDRGACHALQIQETISKPLKPSDLKESIERALRSKIDSDSVKVAEVPAPSLINDSSEKPENPPPIPIASQRAPNDDTLNFGDSGVSPMKLLLVEDSEVNREVALIQLNGWNHEIITAENGKQAVEILAQKTFDGVLMDCQMPEMDGYEATQFIRNPESSVIDHEIYIIAMTANALQGDREKCLKAGMSDYVSKPVDEDELIEALKRCHLHKTQHLPPPVVQATSPTPPPVNESKTSGASINFPPHLIKLFISETEKRLQQMDAALASNHAEDAKNIAHTIKGTAGNFRANELADLAKVCEQLSSENRLDDVRKVVPEMHSTFQRTRKEMDPET
ncbi:MAG: response regulator [Verrucomicrobiota bacterium]